MQKPIYIVIDESEIEDFIKRINQSINKNIYGNIIGTYNSEFIHISKKDKKIRIQIGTFFPTIYTKLQLDVTKKQIINYVHNNLEKEIDLIKIQYKLAGKDYSRYAI